MTAQGTACNGSSEAPKAEFAAEKVAAAAPEDKAPSEQEGEDVGGPFVIVNGDSDGLSDRGSDLGKAPDEDSPSEEDEAPGPNVASDAPAAGDHEPAAVEDGVSDAAPGTSSGDGRDRAAEESKGGADEDKGEASADSVTAEVMQQEIAGGEQGGADAVLANGSDLAVTGAGSDAPALDSEANGEEVTSKEDSAATDVAAATGVSELVMDETTSTEQNAASESCEHDDAVTKTESSSAPIEPEVQADDNNRDEESLATDVELVDQSTAEPGAQVLNEHSCADIKDADDSFEVAAETQSSHADKSKLGDDSTEVADLVEQGDACGEQDGVDALQTDGCTHVPESSDSSKVASESEVHANGIVSKEYDQQEEGARVTETEVEEVVETAGRGCRSIVEDSVEEGNDVDVPNFANVNTDASAEQEAVVEKEEGEATCSILQVEEKIGKDGEDEITAGIASNEEVKLPDAEGINETVPNVDELEGTAEDSSQEIVQGDGLVKDGETYPSVETNKENSVMVEIAQAHDSTAESDLKADDMVEVNTAAPLLSQNCDSVVETVDNEQLETSDVDQPKEIGNDVAEAEVMQEVETEVTDVVPLQAAATSSDSTSHNEPQPTELESTEETKSREISDNTIDQLVSGASLEHESTVDGQAELSLVAGGESQEKVSDSAADQDVPVTLNADELVVADDAEPSSAMNESAGIDNVGVISKTDDLSDQSHDTATNSNFHGDQSQTCNASTACDVAEDISSGNSNSSPKSSGLVETKCLEEHEDKHAHGELAKIGEETTDAQVIRPQKIYVIKVPRFAGEDLWERIQEAHTYLDQLTQERDGINIHKQKQKLVCDEYREKLEAARRQEREARAAHGDKKNDLNSVRSVIGKLNQADSLEEIEDAIANKERILQHETISLKEEKLLIKEINDLKAQRKQLCSNMGSKAELNEAFDQKEHIHERHKTLKKDSDVLFTNLKSLEENTRKIQKSFEDERIILRKLNDEYRAANERRQKAYSVWAELKAEPFKKNKYFFMYKDDRRIAGEHLSSGNMHQVQSYCNNQVERVMEMWNKDEDFRKQYVEANRVSTLRRLGTHDGRRLGPDEEPPVIPSKRPINPSLSLAVSSPNVPTTTTVPAPAPVTVSAKEEPFPVLPSPDISKCAKSKGSGTSAQNEKITVTVSERELKEKEKEKARLMEEELERAKKAEELARMEEKLREEKAAAEKERLRLEQKAKAKEAEERKKRKAEKAQERAEFKARKEAEMKEKRKAKKDKKKELGDSSGNGDSNEALATADTDSNTSDNPREAEVPQPTAPKRISRSAAAIKQLNRLQPMPAPLRNRGKRKMRQYLLIAAAVLSVLALFVAGNYIPRLKSLHS